MANQPSSVEQERLLTIVDLSRGGAGVARDDSGQAIFVPGTAPGDEVRVRITRDEGRYAFAELLELRKPSAIRVEPRCSAFGRCGGCDWQHLPYEEQWKVKREGALYALKRIGLERPSLIEEFPAEEPYGYRNRIQMRGSRGTLGFFARGTRSLVPVESCPVARPEVNASFPAVRAEAEKRTESEYKVEIEVDEAGVVTWRWNSRHAAGGFRQVNDAQNAKLREWIRAHVTPGRRLYDLFGGSGNLSLGLASSMTRIDCVDTGSPGSRDRPESTPKNLIFHRADVLRWLKDETRKIDAIPEDRDPALASTAVLDPPREGCGAGISSVIEALRKLRCDEVLAVGCDPDAWAKDVGRWVRAGYRLEKTAFFDFFPQTPHLESVALLRLPQVS